MIVCVWVLFLPLPAVRALDNLERLSLFGICLTSLQLPTVCINAIIYRGSIHLARLSAYAVILCRGSISCP